MVGPRGLKPTSTTTWQSLLLERMSYSGRGNPMQIQDETRRSIARAAHLSGVKSLISDLTTRSLRTNSVAAAPLNRMMVSTHLPMTA